ncbi:PA3496 family putative envelope integrity protein [Azomonas macrocytogenes]|uniref:Transcriptional regulator n=1 Tax=Azomonas macrocytogenes TaxID=69962 RepID=A0A839T4E6_AZOMA|nr:hypothetical protein [Azomonas macrocytogenes]MBB3104302.1 hypothetical protein [Azomonas macrocytogenes]
MSLYVEAPRILDAKARRKLQDERRMRFRRAIEHYEESLRLQEQLVDYPELGEINGLLAGRAALLRSVQPMR